MAIKYLYNNIQLISRHVNHSRLSYFYLFREERPSPSQFHGSFNVTTIVSTLAIPGC